MNLQSLDHLHFFSRRFHGSCQEGERPARGRVVPRGDFAPMRSNNAERTLRPLWVKSRPFVVQNGMSALPRKRSALGDSRVLLDAFVIGDQPEEHSDVVYNQNDNPAVRGTRPEFS